jgi:signal transduction histidine kinase
MKAGRAPPPGRGGLSLRVVTASALLSLLIAGVFLFLVNAIIGMRDAAALARRSDRVLTAANDLERLVIDLETGQRGYVITHDESFLQPWAAARASFEPKAAELRALASAHRTSQAQRAEQIAKDGMSYIRNYADPLVQAARRDPSAEHSLPISIEGKRRVDAIRQEFRDFIASEHRLAIERDARSTAAAHRAIVVAVGGIGASIVLIVAFSGYLTRGVVRPVRSTSRMACEVARGNLSVRVPETDKAEIGQLERSFNIMAGSLERNRDELTASRARIVAAGDAARRRIERDLHDGTQQRLVTLGLELRMAEADVPPENEAVRTRLDWTIRELTDVTRELREISRGIHPAVLTRGGLVPALATLARRSAVPVDYHLELGHRLRERVEVAVYYVVCEALANAAKHAHASHVDLKITANGSEVRLSIHDDGVGGADPGRGSGLIGLRDRVETLGGDISVISPLNAGTTLLVRLPAEPP